MLFFKLEFSQKYNSIIKTISVTNKNHFNLNTINYYIQIFYTNQLRLDVKETRG